EVIIENADFMPHNFVVVKPGARERVGAISETMKPDMLDSEGRAYVPQTSDVIAATRLLEAGERAVVKMVAPETEGTYPYVCTFPGHWQVMWGDLIVTGNVDEFLRLHPEPAREAAAGHTHTR